MAKAFLVNINLKGNQLLNAVVHQSSGDPSLAGPNAAASKGQLYFDTATNLLKFYNGSSFVPASGGITVGATTYYSATTFAGTTNQITVTGTGTATSGTVTISLPNAVTIGAVGSAAGTLALAGGTSGSVTLAVPLVAGSNTLTLPAATDTLVGKNTTDVLTNKTLTSPTINGGTATALTGLAIRSTGTGAFDLTFANTENLTAGRTLTLTLNDANRTISLGGNVTTASSFTTSGAFALTLTTTGATNVTLPTSGTLAINPTTTIGDVIYASATGTPGTLSRLAGNTATQPAFLTSTGNGTANTTTSFTSSTGSGNVVLATNPSISGGSHTGLTSLGIRDTSAAFDVTLAATSSTALTAGRTVTIDVVNAARTIKLAGNIDLAANFTTSGANALTLTTTGATNVTLPTSGTLVNTAVTSLTSLSTIDTTKTGYLSASAGVLSASSTIPGSAINGNITGNAANVTGIVALANGGTNANLTAAAGGIVWSNATQLQIASAGTSGYLLTSGGTGAPTWTQSTATNVNNAVVQRDASGNISVNQVTVAVDPTQALQVATKQYVDNIASGVNAHDAVVTATTAALTATYNNGSSGIGATLTNSGTQAVLVIDGVTPIVGDRILVKNQASTLQNGIYVVTNVGSVSTNWILTRASDYDGSHPGEVAAGDTVYVVAPAGQITGSPINQNTGWTMNSAGTITIGTSAITFAQSSGTGTVTAGAGTSVTGNQVSINLGSAFDSTVGTGTSGLSLSGNTLQVRLSASGGLTSSTAGLAINTPGTGLTVTGNAISFATGTTSQTDAAVSGGSYTYATQKQVATITPQSPFTQTQFTVNHNLNSRDISVQVYQTSASPDLQYGEVEVDIERLTTSSVRVTFAQAPASGYTYNVVMVG